MVISRRGLFRWKRSTAKSELAPIRARSPSPINRRVFLDRIAKIAAAALIVNSTQGCAQLVKEQAIVDPPSSEELKRNQFNHVFPTRKPGSARSVVEQFDNADKEEIAFIKEKGKPGEMIAASGTRSRDGSSMSWKKNRKPRSTIHGHIMAPQIKADGVVYPGVKDFRDFVLRRIVDPKDYDATLVNHHIFALKPNADFDQENDPRRAIAQYRMSFYFGKRWRELEERNPSTIQTWFDYFVSLHRKIETGRISQEQYIKEAQGFWAMMKLLGMQVRVTPLPDESKKRIRTHV